jgi:probable HAF family extracellular repeat protein
LGINDAGQVVGYSAVGGAVIAAEWVDGHEIDLGSLPGSTSSVAFGINDAGQVVGYSTVDSIDYATEWSDGSVVNLGRGVAQSINDLGQVVGGGVGGATEWSDGSMIILGGLPGSDGSNAYGINDSGAVAGLSFFPVIPPPPIPVPESSAWAMMLLGFARLGLAGYRRAKAGGAILAG